MPEYIVSDLNKITENIEKELGRNWDKNRERFTRKRLLAYLLEDRRPKNEKPKKGDQLHPESWLNDSQPISDQQNCVLYGLNKCPRREIQLKIRT